MKTQVMKLLTLAFVLGMAAPVFGQLPEIQYYRFQDQRGMNVFETSKDNQAEFTGLKIRVGGSFTQQYQALSHSNTPDTNAATQLYALAPGFNLATANLTFDVQLADGIRMNIETYLSSRHHPETWVKGGYIQVDKLPFSGDNSWFNDYLTLRVGHMEVNYGDQHFRRSDNAMTIYNPFVGNTIMDAFATEIGGDLTFQHPSGFLAMVGMTTGEIRGNVAEDDTRGVAILGKVGYDKQLSDLTRVRLTASLYNANSSRNTLYNGDRTGSRFYSVLDNATNANFRSGRFDPGLSNQVTSIMINPFVKVGGLEFFGMYEMANGQNTAETESRAYTQILAEVLYRFLKDDQLYVGGQYNTVSGPVGADDVTISRIQVGAGWYITRNILLKAQYVTQTYDGYSLGSIYHEGTFNGLVGEAVVSF